MPTEAERLTVRATPEQRREAVSSCIAQIMQENPGMESRQAAAICNEQANKATGQGSARVEA